MFEGMPKEQALAIKNRLTEEMKSRFDGIFELLSHEDAGQVRAGIEEMKLLCRQILDNFQMIEQRQPMDPSELRDPRMMEHRQSKTQDLNEIGVTKRCRCKECEPFSYLQPLFSPDLMRALVSSLHIANLGWCTGKPENRNEALLQLAGMFMAGLVKVGLHLPPDQLSLGYDGDVVDPRRIEVELTGYKDQPVHDSTDEMDPEAVAELVEGYPESYRSARYGMEGGSPGAVQGYDPPMGGMVPGGDA